VGGSPLTMSRSVRLPVGDLLKNAIDVHMNRQHHRTTSEPITGKVYWRVVEMARKRGLVNHRSRTPGKPHLQAIMRATGLSYEAVYKFLRRLSRTMRVDPAMLERLCALFQCEPADLLGIDWRYPPHPRAHTASVNPLRAHLSRDWPTRSAERLRGRPIPGLFTGSARHNRLGSCGSQHHDRQRLGYPVPKQVQDRLFADQQQYRSGHRVSTSSTVGRRYALRTANPAIDREVGDGQPRLSSANTSSTPSARPGISSSIWTMSRPLSVRGEAPGRKMVIVRSRGATSRAMRTP
jgi:Cro/C1-type HTH DNA-binding domain